MKRWCVRALAAFFVLCGISSAGSTRGAGTAGDLSLKASAAFAAPNGLSSKARQSTIAANSNNVNCGDCRALSMEEAYPGADAVFLGTVTEVETTDLGNGVSLNSVNLSVDECFKGSTNSTAPNSCPATGRIFAPTPCGLPFQVGEQYVIWAVRDPVLINVIPSSSSSSRYYGNGYPSFTIGGCNASMRTSLADSFHGPDDLQWLRSLPLCDGYNSPLCRSSYQSAGSS